jgi:CDP-4-dehydro-6-deoxyglucose reductase, E1
MNYTWPLINNNIIKQDKEVLADFILTSNRFTNGSKVKEFEKQWSKWLGVKHSVMVNSGASANYLQIAITKHTKGVGEVIVPAMSWVSDCSSVINLGMDLVLVDVNKNNFSMSVDSLRKAITPSTKAIMLVHGLGFNGINEEIIKIAKDNDIMLLEDVCESHGAEYNNVRVGTFGDLSSFSFYFGHHMTTIEGGMLCTNDPYIYELAKMFRSHGFTREASLTIQKEYKLNYPDLNPLFTFAVPGFNVRSSEINAVLGLEQLKRLDSHIKSRQENFEIWCNNLNSEKYFTSFDMKGNSNFALPLITKQESDLTYICELLEKEKIEYRLGTIGGGSQSNQPYIKNVKHTVSGLLTNSNYIQNNALYIGNHPELNPTQIKNLCKGLNTLKTN